MCLRLNKDTGLQFNENIGEISCVGRGGVLHQHPPRHPINKSMADCFLSDDHGFSPLHWACREGRSGVVDMLIMRGARINVMNRGDDTPLHLAASHGHRDIVAKVKEPTHCPFAFTRFSFTSKLAFNVCIVCIMFRMAADSV